MEALLLNYFPSMYHWYCNAHTAFTRGYTIALMLFKFLHLILLGRSYWSKTDINFHIERRLALHDMTLSQLWKTFPSGLTIEAFEQALFRLQAQGLVRIRPESMPPLLTWHTNLPPVETSK